MLRRVSQIFDYLFRRRRIEDDLDEELRASFEMIIDRHIERGLSPADARRAARLDFEGVDQVKEKVRDRLAGSALQSILQDLAHAARGLRRRPGFAAISLITLALGIGVNTAVFSVFYAVLLHPLPYQRPEQLVLVWAGFNTAGTRRAPVSGLILGEIARRNRAFSGVAGIWTLTRTFTGDDPEQVRHARVTTNFFDLLGVHASEGRTFIPSDNGTQGIVLANPIYRRRFNANASLMGKRVPMERASTLLGVLPAGFQLYFAPDANIPSDVQSFDTFSDGTWAQRGEYYIRVVARMKPGVTVAEAQRDVDRVTSEIRAAYQQYGTQNLTLTVAGMHDDAVREIRTGINALFAGAGFILLICCVNVTSLLLARASDRRKEIALRLSLGASRGRILRQLLSEGLVLCAFGGAAGVALGWAGFRGLLAIRPESFARIGEGGMRWPVLAFAAAISLAAALIFALAPAIESFRLDLMETLRTGGRGWLGRFQRRAGGALVIGEITLGFILVTGAALCARTLTKIERAPLGFQAQNLLTFQTNLPGPFPVGLRTWEQQLAAIPGVESVGAISHLPLDKGIPNWYGPYSVPGMDKTNDALVSDLRCVTPGYFATMGTRLIEGRYLDPQDRVDGRTVAVIDDVLARSTWPGESAIGKTIEVQHTTPRGFQGLPTTIVGEVEHVHNHSLTTVVRGIVYMPCEQSPRSPLTFVLRAGVAPLSLVPGIRSKLHDRNPAAAMANIRPMTNYVARELAPAGFTAVLAGVFAGLALLLAATGIFGVLNYQVSQRLPEMGIRMALGARGRDVLRLVLREGLKLAAIGVVLGIAGTFAASKWLGALLYGVGPGDPLSLSLALLLLPAAALLGCWRPANRAAGANPADIIREE